MKILVISNLFPPLSVGGYENLCFKVADALSSRGHQVRVLTSSYKLTDDYIDSDCQLNICRKLRIFTNWFFIDKPYEGSWDEWLSESNNNIAVFDEEVASFCPDVIFAWNLYFFHQSFVSHIEKVAGRQRVVFFLTDNWLVSSLCPEQLGLYMQSAIDEKISASSSSLFCGKEIHTLNSQALFGSEYMRKLYSHLGVSFSRDYTIMNGVTLAEPVFPEFIYNDNQIRLLFAGRIVRLKGLHKVIEAMHLLDGSGFQFDTTLTVVGDCHDQVYADYLSALINSFSLNSRISFKPSLPMPKLRSVFEQHSIYVFPSLYEPFALTLIHAANWGMPIIASRAGGNPELIQHGYNGLLYDSCSSEQLADSIKLLAVAPQLRNLLSANAILSSFQFSFDNMLHEIDWYLH